MRIIFKDGQVLNCDNVDTLVIQDANELDVVDKALRERLKILKVEIAELEARIDEERYYAILDSEAVSE